MSERGYQGYTNYPTWAVCLWLNNDQGLQEGAFELYLQVEDQEPREQEEAFGEWVLDAFMVNEIAEEPSPRSDIMGWAFEQVNWSEVVDCFKPEA